MFEKYLNGILKILFKDMFKDILKYMFKAVFVYVTFRGEKRGGGSRLFHKQKGDGSYINRLIRCHPRTGAPVNHVSKTIRSQSNHSTGRLGRNNPSEGMHTLSIIVLIAWL